MFSQLPNLYSTSFKYFNKSLPRPSTISGYCTHTALGPTYNYVTEYCLINMLRKIHYSPIFILWIEIGSHFCCHEQVSTPKSDSTATYLQTESHEKVRFLYHMQYVWSITQYWCNVIREVVRTCDSHRTWTYLHQRTGVSKSRNIAFLLLARTFTVE